jgi:hypothetical protein
VRKPHGNGTLATAWAGDPLKLPTSFESPQQRQATSEIVTMFGRLGFSFHLRSFAFIRG